MKKSNKTIEEIKEKFYLLKDEDELVLNGKQLREFKTKVEEELKEKFAEDIKDDEKWDLEPCCHALSRRELVKYLTGKSFFY